MLISVHTVVGIFIAKHASSSLMAFVLAVIAHFALDLIPHGDRKLMHWFSRRINRDLVLSITIIDTFITVLYLLYIFTYSNLPDATYLFWAIFGSIMPDFVNTYYQIFKPKFLKTYSHFHESIHDYVPSKMTVKEGLLFQVVLIILLIYITL